LALGKSLKMKTRTIKIGMVDNRIHEILKEPGKRLAEESAVCEVKERKSSSNIQKSFHYLTDLKMLAN